MVTEALNRTKRLTERSGSIETADVGSNTTGGGVGERMWEQISGSPNGKMIEELRQEIFDLQSANRELVEKEAETAKSKQALLEEREGWTKTINELKMAVRDTVTAAARSERARIAEREEMHEQIVLAQETKEEAQAAEVHRRRSEEEHTER